MRETMNQMSKYIIGINWHNTRSKFNIRKTAAAKRKWGIWTSINFASNDWNVS
jgi:hypothetical protein